VSLRQIVIPFEEIKEVEIRCACGTGIVVSIDPLLADLKPFCSACRAPLGAALLAVGKLAESWRFAKEFVDSKDLSGVGINVARRFDFRIAAD